MNYQVLLTVSLLVGYVGVIYSIEFFYKKTGINPEYTRKIGHILSSLSCAVLLLFIDSHWYILFLGLFFFLLLYFARKYKRYKSINAVKRKTAGSFLFPIAIYLVFLVSDLTDEKLYFIFPLLILGISDSLAGILGTMYAERTKKIYIGTYCLEKTYLGTVSFFISSLLVSGATLFFYGIPFPSLLIWALVFGLVTSVTEALSPYGTDNITVPGITVLLIWLMI